jgi:hypothetical protein
VITSDSWTLEDILRKTDGIIDVFVDSSTSIIMEVTQDMSPEVESYLLELVSDTDVKIYEIENTGTLEDVYRSVITHG